MPKATPELFLAGLHLDAKDALPLYRQLYNFIRGAILSGQLPPGQRLPATRVLAADLGVSRNTVILAFESLWSEGYLTGKVGAGTFVNAALPEGLLQAVPSAAQHHPVAPPKPIRLSRRGRTIAAVPTSLTKPLAAVRPFRPGIPAIRDYPHALWQRIATQSRRAMEAAPALYSYADPAGYFPLREALAAYLRRARAVQCTPEQILIVNGSQQAIDLAARVLLDPGETAWVEDPGYRGAKAALRGAEVGVTPVPIDAEGLDVTAAIQANPTARLVYLTPSHQYPLGVTMSLRRRLEILDWAQAHEAWVLEDDYDSEYRYAGHPLASLQGLDTHARVIYLGTFSKVLYPALRLGYMVVPKSLVEVFTAAKALVDRHSPLFEQIMLDTLLREGHFGRHIRRMRLLYQKRQQALVEAVQASLADQLEIHFSAAGLHTIAWLPAGSNDRAVAEAAAGEGIDVVPLSACALQHTPPPGLVMGYAAFTEAEIQQAVRKFVKVFEAMQ